MSQLANILPDEHFGALVQLAAEYVASRRTSEKAYLELKNVNKLSSRDLDLLFVAIVKLIQKFIAVDFFKQDHQLKQNKLLDEMRLTQSQRQVFYGIILKPESRSLLIKDVENSITSPPFVIKVEWRLDVIICSSDSSEEMKPVIEFKFMTTKGTYSCCCTLHVFHEFRLAVANSLKDVYFLNSKRGN